jgi:hypothetical protein
MGVRLEKPWRELTAANVAALAGELGVYQLADAEGRVLRIGYAGGRTLFGLRSELAAALAAGEAAKFRTEVNAQYMSRYDELLMVHKADHGALPPGNAADAGRRLGRLSPG